MSFEPILLAPEEVPKEIYPYRRVWRTGWLEVGTVLLAVIGTLLLTRILGILPTETRDPRLKLGISLLPLAAWGFFSYRGERRALQPREGLVNAVILGALAASGVVIPLEHVFVLDLWLPGAGFFGRVLGYALTLGFTGEFLKYAVLRYGFWPRCFRQRLDGIAYALAVSVGYATVLNLQVAFTADATLPAVALRVASITYSQFAIGIIMGFFLAELRIGRPAFFWLPMGLGLAALLSGLYYGFRSIAIVSGLNVGTTASSPMRGLMLAFGLVAAMFTWIAFVVESADTRMEVLTGQRHHPASEIILLSSESEPLTFTQRWNGYLAIALAVGAVFLGLIVRNGALTATQQFENLEAGVRAQIPAGWLLDTGGEDYVMRAEDPKALPFKTLLQVAVIPIGPDAAPRNVLDLLDFQRAQQYAAYRVIARTEETLRDGSPAIRMTYAYTQDERNPFLESLPLVIQGVDVVVLRRSQAVIVTYREERSHFDAHLYRFENLLQTLEVF